MATINFRTLFSVEAGAPVNGVVVSGGTKVVCYGEHGPIGIVSEVGKTQGSKNAKANSAASVLRPLADGSIKLGVSATNENILCLEYNDETVCIFDTNAMTASYYGVKHPHDASWPYVMLALTECEEADGWLKNFFKGGCIYSIDSKDAFVFCDMVYYYAKVKGKEKITRQSMSEVELKQLKETVQFKNIIWPYINETIKEANGVSKNFTLVANEAARSTTSKVSTFDAAEFGDRVLSGEFIVQHDWLPWQEEMIPDLMDADRHVFTEQEALLIKQLNSVMNAGHESYARGDKNVFLQYGDMLNLMFYGSAAGGKSESAEMIATALQVPLSRVTGSPQLEEDVFEGKTIMKDGHLTSDDGIFLKSFQHGGICVLEETNLVNPGILQGCLSAALEKPYKMCKFKVEEIDRHPMSIIIATLNPGYIGTRQMNKAFKSRFTHKFRYDEINKELFCAILRKNGITEKNIDLVWKVYDGFRTHLAQDEDTAPLRDDCSFRQALGMAHDLERGYPLAWAVENTFISAIEVEDESVADTLRGLVSAM